MLIIIIIPESRDGALQFIWNTLGPHRKANSWYACALELCADVII